MAWHETVNISGWELGAGREMLVAGQVLAVFRTHSGFMAIDGMCAHQGGPLAQGQLDENCLTCPWHGWQYDIRDGKNLLTGKHMLACFATEVRDDVLWIDVDHR